MKRIAMWVILMAGAAAAVSAQGRDFAGKWTLDIEKSGTKDGPPALTVTMSAKALVVQMGERPEQALTLNLDGSPHDLGRGATATMAWKGDAVAATIASPNGAQVMTFARQGQWLTMEGKSGKGPMKLYFKKAPSHP
jgi:hypothetical protein